MNVIACQITVQNKNWHLAGGLKEISIIFFSILHEIGADKKQGIHIA